MLCFFVCVCTVYVPFCASGIKLCTPDALQYWLDYIYKCEANTQIHVLMFFHKDETTTHLPRNMQQSMRYNYIQSHIRMANTRTSTVDGDMEQLFWASKPLTMHPRMLKKALNFEL